MTELSLPRADQSPGAPAQQTHSKRRETLASIALFALQRLGFGLLTLLAIIFLTFLGLDMAGGADLGPAAGDALSQTVDYLGRLAHLDLGVSTNVTSADYPLPVAEVLPDILMRSLALLGLALVLATVVGGLMGLWAAHRKNSNWSLVTLVLSLVGVSVPSFFAALVLQELIIQWTRTTGQQLLPLGGFGWDKRLILPVLVLAARPIAQVTRITFNAIGNTLDQDYVRTARSKGLRAGGILRRHVLRNAAVPILTTVGVSLRFSLTSLPVVEYFFGWQGVGFLLLKGIANRDDNLTVALLVCLGSFFILVNLLLEIVYRFIDPRLREQQSQVATEARRSAGESLRLLWSTLVDMATHNPLTHWLRQLKTRKQPSPFRAVLEQNGQRLEISNQETRTLNWRSWRRGTLGNLSFMLGGLLVLLLLIAFIFGPKLTPYSPYSRHGLEFIDGVLAAPPFEPGDTYPWGTDMLGRDILSLVLAGTQQTLMVAGLVVIARIVLGFMLGAIAGWLNGSTLDRVILAAAEIIATFPTLLFAMILILALGIREGLRPFLIALCLVGWDEIMQFVRSEVMSLRSELFIESAISVGARTPRIILGHVLPNLLSNLISLAALEMGAVLMLLGELGFIGIFIGGGAFAELNTRPGAPRFHYSDVPEWGSLLSSIRLYARAYPWTALYPSLAFFVSILGFNLFGEGIRRLMQQVGVQFTRLFNRYTLAAGVAALAALVWMQSNTGASAYYRRQAAEFDGALALQQVEALSAPEMEERAIGTAGMERAADYVAEQFEALGLQPAGDEFSYFQTRKRSYQVFEAAPELTIQDGGPPLAYRQDYREYVGPNRVLGEMQAPVHFIAWNDLTRGQWNAPALRSIDLSDGFTLLLSDEYLSDLYYSTLGILVVAPDEETLGRSVTVSGVDPFFTLGSTQGRDRTALYISEETADRLLSADELTVAELRRQVDGLKRDELLELVTTTEVRVNMQGTGYENQPVVNVIGHLPGVSAESYEMELNLDSQVVLVMAQYDNPPLSPDGVAYPAANDNASGVAVMLEAIRTMQNSDYEPYRTFIFVAYSAEGEEGGNPAYPPDPLRFLESKYGFSDALTLEAVVDIRGVGAGSGDGLSITASGSLRLANLFEESARRMGVKATRTGEQVDITIIYDEGAGNNTGQDAPQVGLHWQGWEATSRTPADTLEAVSADKLEQAGQVLSLALMTMGHELSY